MEKVKQITCMVCFREFRVKQHEGRSKYVGTCPYCVTYDNGTAFGRLSTNAELALCEEFGHEWVLTRDGVYKCQRCGYWEKRKKGDLWLSITDYR